MCLHSICRFRGLETYDAKHCCSCSIHISFLSCPFLWAVCNIHRSLADIWKESESCFLNYAFLLDTSAGKVLFIENLIGKLFVVQITKWFEWEDMGLCLMPWILNILKCSYIYKYKRKVDEKTQLHDYWEQSCSRCLCYKDCFHILVIFQGEKHADSHTKQLKKQQNLTCVFTFIRSLWKAFVEN